MQPFRFVHCADVHLDTPYHSRSGSLRRRLTEAGREAFRAAVDLCFEEEAHALLVAGDLFDNDRLSFTTEAFLVGEIDRLSGAGKSVIIVTGNHDPGRAANGNRAHGIAWPEERCHLLRSNVPDEIVVSDPAGLPIGRVIGAGHQTAHDTTNLAARYPDSAGPEPTVGLLHTQVQGSAGEERHEPYAPCTPEDLGSRAYGYWALGHVHKRQRVADLPAWYAGNLQGRHFGETGAKGALLVTLRSGEQAEVAFRALAPVRWEVLEVDGLGAVTHLADLRAAVEARFDAVRNGPDVMSDQEWMLRVVLSGPCPLADELRAAEARAEVGEALVSLPGVLDVEVRTTHLSRPVDLGDHRGQPHVLGLALEIVDELALDPELLERLAPVPPAGLSKTDGDARRAYLRGLLAGLDRAAAEALIVEGA